MTDSVVTLTSAEAQRLTLRIKLTAGTIRDNMVRLYDMVSEAKAGNAHVALGFPSWTAYLTDTLGEEPLRLDREQRQSVVSMLTAEGLSSRAIAPIVAVDQKTVVNDQRRAREEISSPARGKKFRATSSNVTSIGSRPRTPEVMRSATIGEATGASRSVTGLDGKKYSQAPTARPKPAVYLPSLAGGVARDLRAIETTIDIIRSHGDFDGCRRDMVAEVLPEVRRSIETLTRFIEAVMGEKRDVG